MHQVQVGGFFVTDISGIQLREVIQDYVGCKDSDRPAFVLAALHVGGLNARSSTEYVKAANRADALIADGMAAVWLARLAGAQAIERCPTTDLGWALVRDSLITLGRPPRLAAVGGPAGLAESAMCDVCRSTGAEVVYTRDGYSPGLEMVPVELQSAKPDILFLGLGAERETRIGVEWARLLPGVVIVTCGGWFGHVVGSERRAPILLQRLGLEWLVRLAQAPRRLLPRYAQGVVTVLCLSVKEFTGRNRHR